MATGGINMTFYMLPTPTVMAADFASLAAGIRSLREPLKDCIREVFSPSFRWNFVEEGRPDPWQELADETILEKIRLGFPMDILTRTGTLTRVAGQLNIWDIDGGYASGEASASVSDLHEAGYGWVHQDGTDKVPQRQWAVFQDEDIDKAERIFDRYIHKRLKMAGF